MLPNFLTNMTADIYHSNNYTVLDLETDTSHGDYGCAIHEDNGLLLASYRTGEGHSQHVDRTLSKWGSEFDQRELVELIEDSDFLVAHNAKYELMWLLRCKLDIAKVLVFDTQLAEYVLLGNLAAGDEMNPRKSISLDMCCRRRGYPIKDPVVDKMMKQGINPVRMPKSWLQGRCEQDVDTTEDLFKSQLKRLVNTNRLSVLYTRCLLTPVLSACEFEGMSLDSSRVEKEYEKYQLDLIDLQKEMDTVTGGINWRSPDQVSEFIYETMGFDELKDYQGNPRRTKEGTRTLLDGTVKATGGKRKTDKKTLEKLKARTKTQRNYIELKSKLGKVGAAMSKNLEFFLGVCREKSGIFKATFHQTETATHRLSSKGIKTQFELFENPKSVQFQNLPIVFKPLFQARRKGWLMAETDGSQLEFRVAAHMSRDPVAQSDILSGHDVHRFTGSVIYHAPSEWLKDIGNHIADLERLMPEVTKEERQRSKLHTFKPTYGGTSGTPREKAYYAAFKARYKVLTQVQEGWTYEVMNSPYKELVTEFGLRYYWPYIRISQSGYCNVGSAVYNYPIQALGTAEIIPIALTFFWHRVIAQGLQDKIKIVNTIHDSIICEIHPDVVQQYKEISIQAFTKDVYEYLYKVYNIKFDFVPLGVGITIGNHWTEGAEESYDVHFDGKMESRT